jgi:hypothetical protein
VVNGQTVPIVTGDYELAGKSRGASTRRGRSAERQWDRSSGAGAGSEIVTKGDQVKVPSETLIDFTLQQDVSIPTYRN